MEKLPTYFEFTSDLPLDRTLVFNSATKCQAWLDSVEIRQETYQSESGDFRCDMAFHETTSGSLFADRYSTAVTLMLEMPEGIVGLLFPRSVSGQFLACGEQLDADTLLVVPSGVEVDIAVPALAGSEAIAIPIKLYTKLAFSLPDEFRPLQDCLSVTGAEGSLQPLKGRLLELLASAEACSDKDVESLIGDCVRWLKIYTHERPEAVDHLDTESLAKTAQQFMLHNFSEKLVMADLCAATGAQMRTLQRSFRRYFGQTASNYLKSVRLDSAYRELSQSETGASNVTVVASNNGYNHMGRFSMDFHERFGIKPSDLLREKPFLD